MHRLLRHCSLSTEGTICCYTSVYMLCIACFQVSELSFVAHREQLRSTLTGPTGFQTALSSCQQVLPTGCCLYRAGVGSLCDSIGPELVTNGDQANNKSSVNSWQHSAGKLLFGAKELLSHAPFPADLQHEMDTLSMHTEV